MNVSKVTNIRSQTDENKSSIAALYQAIQECLNNDVHIVVEGSKGKPKFWIEHPFDWDPDFQEEFNHIGFNEEVAEAGNDFSPDFYDVIYLNMELSLPKRGKPEKQFARFTKCLRDSNGLLIGKASDKPILDTHMYKVEYTDGKKSALIVEKMFAQIDEQVNRYVLM